MEGSPESYISTRTTRAKKDGSTSLVIQ